jgi:hypothetical protein
MNTETRHDLDEQIRRLTADVNEMRIRLATIEGDKGTSDGSADRPNRRRFLTLGAGAALGAVGLAASRVLPAAAANGGNFILGQANLAESTTKLTGDGASGAPTPVLGAAANGTTWIEGTTGTFAGPLQGQGISTGPVDGVDGWAGGTQGFGVYGLTDAGVGTVGESSTGVSVYARGSGRILQDPHALSSGVPDYAANNFEQVRDASGALWISRPAPVNWQQIFSLQAFPNPRRIVDGFATPFTSGVTYGPFDATKKSDNVTPTGIPVGASAAYCAVQSYSPGVLTLFPDLSADPGIANYSGAGTSGLNMLYMLVPLSAAGKFKIHAYFTGKVFVDAWGFLM